MYNKKCNKCLAKNKRYNSICHKCGETLPEIIELSKRATLILGLVVFLAIFSIGYFVKTRIASFNNRMETPTQENEENTNTEATLSNQKDETTSIPSPTNPTSIPVDLSSTLSNSTISANNEDLKNLNSFNSQISNNESSSSEISSEINSDNFASNQKYIESESESINLSAYATEVGGVIESGDNINQLSGWNIQSIDDTNSTVIFGKRTIYWGLSNSKNKRTVSLYKDSAGLTKIAEGSRTNNGVIDLTGLGEYKIRGTVTIAYNEDDIASGANFLTQSAGIKLEFSHSVSSPTKASISRRIHGSDNWQVISQISTDATDFTDANVDEGIKYDYEYSIEDATRIYSKTIYTQMPIKLLGFMSPIEDRDGIIYGIRKYEGYSTKLEKLVNNLPVAVSTYTTPGFIINNLFIDHNNRFFSTGNYGSEYGNGYINYTDDPTSWNKKQVLLNPFEPTGKFIPRGVYADTEGGDTQNAMSNWKIYGHDSENTDMTTDEIRAFRLYWNLTIDGAKRTISLYKNSDRN